MLAGGTGRGCLDGVLCGPADLRGLPSSSGGKFPCRSPFRGHEKVEVQKSLLF